MTDDQIQILNNMGDEYQTARAIARASWGSKEALRMGQKLSAMYRTGMVERKKTRGSVYMYRKARERVNTGIRSMSVMNNPSFSTGIAYSDVSLRAEPWAGAE